jgi:hypothetical protein
VSSADWLYLHQNARPKGLSEINLEEFYTSVSVASFRIPWCWDDFLRVQILNVKHYDIQWFFTWTQLQNKWLQRDENVFVKYFALKAWKHADIIVWKTLMTQFLNSAKGFAIFQVQAMPPFSLHVTTSRYKCWWHEWQSKSHKAKGCTHAHQNCQCKTISQTLRVSLLVMPWMKGLTWVCCVP